MPHQFFLELRTGSIRKITSITVWRWVVFLEVLRQRQSLVKFWRDPTITVTLNPRTGKPGLSVRHPGDFILTGTII
jgi:hypothetical protein